MASPFPPGGTNSYSQGERSRWREFAFVFHQLKRAIEPELPLADVIDDWMDIASALAESPRKRTSQIASIFDLGQTS